MNKFASIFAALKQLKKVTGYSDEEIQEYREKKVSLLFGKNSLTELSYEEITSLSKAINKEIQSQKDKNVKKLKTCLFQVEQIAVMLGKPTNQVYQTLVNFALKQTQKEYFQEVNGKDWDNIIKAIHAMRDKYENKPPYNVIPMNTIRKLASKLP